MTANETRNSSTIALTAVLAVLLAALVGVLTLTSGSGSSADAARAKTETVMLGAVGPMPDPRCPSNCQALAIVSGIQSRINNVSVPFRVPFDGKIVRWKLALGKPNKSQRQFFQQNFGKKPKAGISVLKKVKVKGKTRYKLRKRSPIQGLNKDMGTVASYKLENPINVAKGNYIALTVPSWAPALATGLNEKGYSWRASRAPSTCDGPINRKTSSPQTKKGSKVQYGCSFGGTQMLYRVKLTGKA